MAVWKSDRVMKTLINPYRDRIKRMVEQPVAYTEPSLSIDARFDII